MEKYRIKETIVNNGLGVSKNTYYTIEKRVAHIFWRDVSIQSVWTSEHVDFTIDHYPMEFKSVEECQEVIEHIVKKGGYDLYKDKIIHRVFNRKNRATFYAVCLNTADLQTQNPDWRGEYSLKDMQNYVDKYMVTSNSNRIITTENIK